MFSAHSALLIEKLPLVILNISMRAVKPLQQILFQNRIKLLASEINVLDNSDGAKDLSGGRLL